MAKDKKGKSDSKKQKLAEKKQKQEKKGQKKEKNKASKLEGSDAEDVDLDAVLAEYKKQQELFLKVTETVLEAPPKPRSSATFLASPSHSNQLLLFGGETWNGALASFFNDLNIYYTDRDEWHCVTSPNAPLPRSGHAWCRGGNQKDSVFLFGGEFSSPKQGTFYHYNDFWRLEPSTREWTRVDVKGKTPPSRSGHRMTYYKNYIILFGGFQDTSNQTKYLNDLWLFDTQNFFWHSPVLPPAQLKPDARSSFTFLPHEQGAVLFGGYSRVKATVLANKSAKGSSQGQRNILKPMVHQDCFFLRITQPPADSPPNTPPNVRWEKRKMPANKPSPARVGATMAYHKGRGILFGGVHDVEQSEEGIESEFFNQMYTWNIERNRFFPMTLRKPRAQKKVAPSEQRVGRRGRAQANEQELLKQLAALETGASLEDADEMDIDVKPADKAEEPEKPLREMPVSMEYPSARFNAQLAVQDDFLYIYGGTFEAKDREYTFDDLYSIDLGKMDGCKEIFKREDETWVGSEDEDEDEEEDEEDEDEEEYDEDDDVDMDDEAPKFTPSKRKKKQGDDEVSVDTASTTESTAPSEEESEADTAASSVDDGLPHPRPFETRRDFFARTSAEWQEILMTSLRWKNIQPETLTIKEIKSKAFELSEEKWWDCREEITALEDEQEAAGIGEVVSLTDRGDAAGGAGFERLNSRKSQPNDHINFIKPLKGPDEKIAQDFLERIAAQCVPVMRENHIYVMALEEFPPNREFVGRNFNAGEVVQLVLKSPSTGRWLPFNYVQMVMMHELAHCKQMNHSKAFWAVRNQYAEQMRGLWSKKYSGEGLWGRGVLLTSGEFEANTVLADDSLPEHLCGGTYRSRGRKRKPKQQLSYQERKERRILKKFGANGVALGEDEDIKTELENGKKPKGKPRVAGSKRGRELRAAAALARFDQQKKVEELKEEDDDDATESESESDSEIKGESIVDNEGRHLIKVCEDEDPTDMDAQNELRELASASTIKRERSEPPAFIDIPDIEEEEAAKVPSRPVQKRPKPEAKVSARDKPSISSTKTKTIVPKTEEGSQSKHLPQPVPGNCPICSFKNTSDSLVCEVCQHVLAPGKVSFWKCKSKACRDSQSLYLNPADSGICGVCGERKPPHK
ncbi:WLM domain-containing protein [Xylariaceae sp. FL1272]|nr:WLM domain-containing protein [Xylariaceae sp. FL1272]